MTADGGPLTAESYTYDPVGNRLTSATVNNWTYNQNNELKSYNGVSFQYDLNGNTVQKTEDGGQRTDYRYDESDRLTEVKDENGAIIATYYYDPFGRRLWKDVRGVWSNFMYADEGLIAEFDATGSEAKSYGYAPNSTWTTNPLFMKQGAQYYFYHNDHLGTPQKMTSPSGAVVWSAKYESFGNAVIDPTSTVANNLRFPGQYYDSETGLHYNYHRYYDPQFGRYLMPDPVRYQQGKGSLYIYAKQSPANFLDPLGLCEWKGSLSMLVFGRCGLGAGLVIMGLESECCNNRRAHGVYIAPVAGVFLGPLPVQAVSHLVAFDGPETPSHKDPIGMFQYVSAGGTFGIGISWTSVISGDLYSPPSWGWYFGVDLGLDMLWGFAVGFGETSDCCYEKSQK